MCDDDTFVSQRMCNKPIVGDLQEDCDGGWLVSVAAGPIAYGAKRRQHSVIRWQEELFTARSSPHREFIASGLQFVRNLFDARDFACAVCSISQAQNAGQKSNP